MREIGIYPSLAFLSVRLRRILVGTGVWIGLWSIAAFQTQLNRTEALTLVGVQGILAGVALWVLTASLPQMQSRGGPWMLPVFSLHVILYYGVFNIIPALLPEWRPELIVMLVLYRIPASPISSYTIATAAAIMLLVGVQLGSHITQMIRCRSANDAVLPALDGRVSWMPGYNVSISISVSLTAVILLATMRYGPEFGLLMTDLDRVRALPFWEQLLYHGIFPFLPLPSLLATNAALIAPSVRARRWSVVLLVVVAILGIASLSVWGMRTPALMVFALPMCLLVYAQKVNWKLLILPSILLGGGVYTVVTIARLGEIGFQLRGDKTSVSQIMSLIQSSGENDQLLQQVISDISYRNSGLEASASLITGQEMGAIPHPLYGEVTAAGFLQALPASLRPQSDIPKRLKTAPAHYGWFAPGDWVTPLLCEVLLDSGPWLALFHGILIGILLTFVDDLFLQIGQHPTFQSVLVIRFGWLLLLLHAPSVAELTLMFLKASVGFALFFVFISFVSRIRRTKHSAIHPAITH